MQGFNDKATTRAAIARRVVQHLRADGVQSPQIGIFRPHASLQLDFNQPAQTQQSGIILQFTIEKLHRGVLALLLQQPFRQGVREAATMILLLDRSQIGKPFVG